MFTRDHVRGAFCFSRLCCCLRLLLLVTLVLQEGDHGGGVVFDGRNGGGGGRGVQLRPLGEELCPVSVAACIKTLLAGISGLAGLAGGWADAQASASASFTFSSLKKALLVAHLLGSSLSRRGKSSQQRAHTCATSPAL